MTRPLSNLMMPRYLRSLKSFSLTRRKKLVSMHKPSRKMFMERSKQWSNQTLKLRKLRMMKSR